MVPINPTIGVEKPTIERSRDRIAGPDEAALLLAALEPADRPLWATALYAGLRRGELTALRWEDVDLAAGTIHVQRGWDNVDGEIEPRSREGKRKVPIPAALRDYLVEHRMRDEPTVRVFEGPSPIRSLIDRAKAAWARDGLDPITLHECRHTYASLMIAAGVNAKALATFTGHANISITLDLYGHLMPGSEAEAAGMLDAYLRRARGAGGTAPASTEGRYGTGGTSPRTSPKRPYVPS